MPTMLYETSLEDFIEVSYEHELNYISINKNSVSEVFYPLRWNVTIDGEIAEYFKTNGVIRGLIIPKGRHKVTFNYDRSSFNKGIYISLGSFFITIGMIVFGGYRRSKY